MKKKLFALFLLACLFLAMPAGCGSQNTETPDGTDDAELSDNFENVEEEDGVWMELDSYCYVPAILTITDTEETYETGSFSTWTPSGMTVGEVLAECGVTAVEPSYEDDTFEGWMEFEVIITTDEDGWEEYTYVCTSDKLYTYEELLELVVPDHNVTYAAKWASIPVEEYYVATESGEWDEISTSGLFTFFANGGTMTFLDSEDFQYDSPSYTYWVDEGDALSTLTGTDGWAALIDIQKEGATFTGWTLYQADTLYWSDKPSEDEGSESFLTDPDWDAAMYTVLVNPVVVRELSSTEELCGISCYGENYFAVANWE